jgi:hypothetical protein
MNAIVTRDTLKSAVAELVASVTGHKAASNAASEVSKTAAANLRNVASLTASAGMNVSTARDFVVASMKAAGIKPGTVKPYSTAFTGYRQALAEGVAIDTGHGKDNANPMPAPAAREFNLSVSEREARAKLAAARKELNARITACTDLALLAELTELLPEVVKDGKAPVVNIDPEQFLAGIADEADAPAEAVAA